MNNSNLNRWEEKEFLSDWVKHAPTGSLDKSVDDILSELGMLETPAPKAEQPKPVQPTPAPKAGQPKPAQPTPAPKAEQPKPVQPAPVPKAEQPKPVQPTPAPKAEQPKPVQPTPAPKAEQPKPVQPAPAPKAEQPKPVQPTPAPAKAAAVPAVAETAAEAVAAAPVVRKKRKKDKWIWRFLSNLLPLKGDGALELIRKGICMCAVLVLVGSCCVLLNDFVLTPLFGNRLANQIDDFRKQPVDPNDDDSLYPAGILDSFKNLYKKNPDTIGWITYKSTSPYWHKKLADPGYVVVQANDNDYYLHRDFDGNDDKNGTIYMDYRCKYDTKEDAKNSNRVTILYGHNMYSGLMFANVNKLLDSLAYAQSAPIVEFSSLFEENQYKVFAVASYDSTEKDAYSFLKTDFANDQEFLEYVAEARLRSWYNYNSVDVRADDQVLVLFTCSNTYQTTMGKEGRTILFARKVRTGESTDIDISTISENSGKLMPRQWYTNNDMSLPSYYTSKDAAAEALKKQMLGDGVSFDSESKKPKDEDEEEYTPPEDDTEEDPVDEEVSEEEILDDEEYNDYDPDEYYSDEDYITSEAEESTNEGGGEETSDEGEGGGEETPAESEGEETPVEDEGEDEPVEEPVEDVPVEEPVEETPAEETDQ